MLQDSARNVPYEASSSSSSSNQDQQPGLFNWLSNYLFQNPPGSLLREEYSKTRLSAHSGRLTSSIGGACNGEGTLANDSALDENNGSHADSMCSTSDSNHSNMINTNTPSPVRTVRLDGVICRSSDVIPSFFYRRSPAQPTINDDDNTTTISYSETVPPASTIDDLLVPVGSLDQAFEKMTHEYGLPDNVAKSLVLEAKRVLLRSGQAYCAWGIPSSSQNHHVDVRRNLSTSSQPSSSSAIGITNPNFGKITNKHGHNGKSINSTQKKIHSTSTFDQLQCTSITNFNQDLSNQNSLDGNAIHRSSQPSLEKVLSPEYFVNLLRDTHVRDLDESQVQNLQVCLQNDKASWTTQFLKLDGYYILSSLFHQMDIAPKRSPNDDRILQQLTKCFKAIMTHKQAGISVVLANPIGLEYIRDLLFGKFDPKQRVLYSLSVITRAHFLNILCTLPSIQTTPSDTVPYIHGYDVLRRLLLDRSPLAATATTTVLSDNNDGNTAKSNNTNHLYRTRPIISDATTNNDSTFSFRMTLDKDMQTIMKVILENDPFYINGQPWKPRYTDWMRELQYTVEKEIEPITQVLDYKFESAFRQLCIAWESQDSATSSGQWTLEKIDAQKDTQVEGIGSDLMDAVMVEYLIAHLRLINTVVAAQPIFYTEPYDYYGMEKVRMEVMMSGFDKISNALQSFPHINLYSFYSRYVQPLLHPLADITPESDLQKE